MANLMTEVKVRNDIEFLSGIQKYKCVYEFIKKHDLKTLEKGRYQIDEDNFVNIIEYTTTNEDNGVFEIHRVYDDVQFIIQGKELIKWQAIDLCTPTSAYAQEGDCQFLTSKSANDAHLAENSFLICSPDVAHKPGLADGCEMAVKKAVFKIKA